MGFTLHYGDPELLAASTDNPNCDVGLRDIGQSFPFHQPISSTRSGLVVAYVNMYKRPSDYPHLRVNPAVIFNSAVRYLQSARRFAIFGFVLNRFPCWTLRTVRVGEGLPPPNKASELEIRVCLVAQFGASLGALLGQPTGSPTRGLTFTSTYCAVST